MGGLARLLNGEEQVSDLIAFLADLDPEPLRRVLDLRTSGPTVVRESLITAPAGEQSGRIDLLVNDATGSPLALVEVKLGAGQHGQQYGLYAEWAAQHAPAPGCWLVSLSGSDSDAPAGWRTQLTLPQLVAAWRESTHPHAAWLGGMVADVLERRALQLHQRLGLADDPIVADLLVKQLKADLEASPTFARVRGWLWSGMRTDGGAPMLLIWVPLPGHDSMTSA